ncbi:PLP-dependent aminotransferase family protein [Marinobacter salarius]|uniref:MocR-like pyridoxine biosynthesis transcription factor PdxR n=1 Tax=Marinobacter salarius TaxID=1420917 RepID=UPI00273C4C3D|nr:PLP-dependent aminotransferase family protein [Marinobacter salarius]MDP4531460.1 PLP-dependent aminotransferase family protein [Marinobacter salarius]
MDDLRIELNRQAGTSLVEQIVEAIGKSISEGRLYSGARLPSWRDLSAQLGVARGTVKSAYERLIDEQLLVARGAAGTFVADQLPIAHRADTSDLRGPLPEFYQHPFGDPAMVFQVGIPAQDVFPYKVWSRIASRAAREAAMASVSYPDPRGEPALRAEIAAYLSVARGLVCSPAQVIVTSGYAGALGLILHALDLKGATAWTEEPGYPMTRTALSMAGIEPVPVSVDEQGLDVDDGLARAPNAALAMVTASQQAPLGVTLSLARRHQLLEWAARRGSWIIEDDYLSELQLIGRAAPALASQDSYGRVVHIGTFSKTVSPGLRLGFIVVPPALANRVGDVAAALAPAASIASQRALGEFMRKGHYLRHLRRMKRTYTARRSSLQRALKTSAADEAMAGLALLLRLPDGTDDARIALNALEFGLAPAPLSTWYTDAVRARSGLLLGITNIPDEGLDACCNRLKQLAGIGQEHGI